MLPENVLKFLDFAIGEEEAAYHFYLDLASKMDRKSMKKIFEEFAHEEKRHKGKLEGIKKGDVLQPTFKTVVDMKIGDYLIDVDPDEDLDYQKALILAMKKEKSAFMLYSDLAEAAENEELKDILKALAQEEAKHKLRFEIEYDNVFYKEN